jgi:hypothetical protein
MSNGGILQQYNPKPILMKARQFLNTDMALLRSPVFGGEAKLPGALAYRAPLASDSKARILACLFPSGQTGSALTIDTAEANPSAPACRQRYRAQPLSVNGISREQNQTRSGSHISCGLEPPRCSASKLTDPLHGRSGCA